MGSRGICCQCLHEVAIDLSFVGKTLMRIIGLHVNRYKYSESIQMPQGALQLVPVHLSLPPQI